MSYRDLPALLAAIEEATTDRPVVLDTTAYVPCARPDCEGYAVRWLSPYCTPDCARRVASWVDDSDRQDPGPPRPRRIIGAPPPNPHVTSFLARHRAELDRATWYVSTTPDTSTRDHWDDALHYARSSPDRGVLDGDWGRPTHVDSMGHLAHGCAIVPPATKPRPRLRPPWWRRLVDALRSTPW